MVVLAALIGLPEAVRAQDAAGPSGTWKWSMRVPGQRKNSNMTLKLKVKGQKLTGTIQIGREKVTSIEKGLIAAKGIIVFWARRSTKDRSVTVRYSGRVVGNAINGTIQFGKGGAKTRAIRWIAKRVK